MHLSALSTEGTSAVHPHPHASDHHCLAGNEGISVKPADLPKSPVLAVSIFDIRYILLIRVQFTSGQSSTTSYYS